MDSGQREQNYWPGFVDALSNVVLTLVFVIVIFVFALVMSAGAVKKKAEELSESKAKIEAQQQNASSPLSEELAAENALLRQQLEQAEAELQKINAAQKHGDVAESTSQTQVKEENIDVTETPDQTKEQKSSGVEVSGDKIIVKYPFAVADLDSQSSAALVKVLGNFKAKMGNRKITIRAIGGNQPFSAAQRYSYYRAISIRNMLLSQKIADSSSISSIISPPAVTGGDCVEIIFNK